MTNIEKLAKITSASLCIERTILSFWIHVNYEDGMGQGIGGLALDTYDKSKNRRIGTAFGCEVIKRLLVELNVNDFSEMTEKIIWVIGSNDSYGNFEPKGIRALNVDKVSKTEGVIFSNILEEFKGEEK